MANAATPEKSTFSRRSLIKGTALGALAWSLPAPGNTADRESWQGKPFAIAAGIGAALFWNMDHADKHFPETDETHLQEELHAFLMRLDPAMTSDLQLLMRVVEWGPLPLAGKFSRFSSMTRQAQHDFVASFADHWAPPIRTAFRALKLIYALLFFSDAKTWPALTYDGPWIGRVDIPYYEPEWDDTDLPVDQVLP